MIVSVPMAVIESVAVNVSTHEVVLPLDPAVAETAITPVAVSTVTPRPVGAMEKVLVLVPF